MIISLKELEQMKAPSHVIKAWTEKFFFYDQETLERVLRSFSEKKLNDALIWFLSRRVDWTAEFLELGADCDVYSSNYPHTPLQAAILDKHFSVITFLLEKKCKTTN